MKIGAINAYHHDPSNPQYQLDYSKLFVDFLKRSLPGTEITQYKVGLGNFPKDMNECDGYVISGSPKGAYDKDEWILKLQEFIREAHKTKKKIFGICFGHQIIAQALGGKTEKSVNGWGVGVASFKIKKETPWMSGLSDCSLLFSHQDQVVKLPPDATLLAESEFCPNQMFSIGSHIYSMQGHPEFSPEFAKDRLDTRIEKVGKDKYEQALKTLYNPTNANEVGAWVKRFFS